LLVDGLASSSASVVHIAHEVAVVGVLEGEPAILKAQHFE